MLQAQPARAGVSGKSPHDSSTRSRALHLVAPRAQRELIAYRQALAEANLGLVQAIAYLVRARTSWRLDIEELKAAGALGLVEAAQRFDPSLGIPFGAFARPRIEGAMLDFLRFTDPVTRQHRNAINAGTAPAIIEVAYDDALVGWTAPDPAPDACAAVAVRLGL